MTLAIFEPFNFVVFEYVDGSWRRKGSLIRAGTFSMTETNTWIGKHMAISDDGRVVVSPTYGKVYEFEDEIGQWLELAHPISLYHLLFWSHQRTV